MLLRRLGREPRAGLEPIFLRTLSAIEGRCAGVRTACRFSGYAQADERAASGIGAHGEAAAWRVCLGQLLFYVWRGRGGGTSHWPARRSGLGGACGRLELPHLATRLRIRSVPKRIPANNEQQEGKPEHRAGWRGINRHKALMAATLSSQQLRPTGAGDCHRDAGSLRIYSQHAFPLAAHRLSIPFAPCERSSRGPPANRPHSS
jgi:hypothetical protein